MCAPPFETYFFQFHALFTWKQDVRPPICDKTAPPHLENPGSATGIYLSTTPRLNVHLIFALTVDHKIIWGEE